MEENEAQMSESHDEGYEQEAKLYGWVPKDEFRGNPDEWRDAKSFVERGREISPILKENNKRLLRELDKAKSELSELKLTVKEFGDHYSKLSETAYKRAIDEVKSQMRVARRDDDHELVDQLEEQLETLKDEAKNVKVPGQGKNDEERKRQEGQRILNEWAEDNSWYNQDKNPDLFYAAEGIAMNLSRERPDLVGKREFLDEITSRVKKTMPDKFENPRKKAGSPVSGSSESRTGVKNSGKKSYNDLPADAKAACDRFVKTIPNYTKEKYVAEYFGDEQ